MFEMSKRRNRSPVQEERFCETCSTFHCILPLVMQLPHCTAGSTERRLEENNSASSAVYVLLFDVKGLLTVAPTVRISSLGLIG
jgi:hypothetical protein